MGILKSIFKKPVIENPNKPEKTEIRMEDLSDWVKKSNQEKLSSIISEIEGIWKELDSYVSQLKSSVKDLEKASFEKADKTYAVVNMTKDLFVKKYQILNKIPPSIKTYNFENVQLAYNSSQQILKEINEANSKQVYVISTYFKKESERIVKFMKTLGKILSDFDKKMGSDWTLFSFIGELDSKIALYKNLEEKSKNAEKEIMEISMEINKLNSEADSQRLEMKKILSDVLWIKLEGSSRQIQEIESEIQKIKSSILEDFSSISRPIKKVLHEANLTKEQRSILSQELDPENINQAYSIFNEAQKVLSENKVVLKESESEKLDYIKSKIKSGEFENAQKILAGLIQRKKALDIENIDNIKIEEKRKEKENAINSIEKDLEKAKIGRGYLESQKADFSKSIDGEKSEIVKFLKERLNKEVVITP